MGRKKKNKPGNITNKKVRQKNVSVVTPEKRPAFAIVFDLIDVGFYLFLAYQYFRFWISPNPEDIHMIFYFAILMGFEFIMAHSGVFMAVMKPKFSILIFFPLYGLFALSFTAIVGDLSIVWIYLIVVFNRMRYAFFNVDSVEKSRVILSAVSTIIIYFFLLIIIAICSGIIPELGLTEEFLISSGYNDAKKIGGILTDMPQTAMCMGGLYYILIAWANFKIKRFYR